jgi:flagellar biosynthesis chaperone FliJ
MKKHFFIPLIILLALACNPQRQKEVVEAQNQRQQLYDEVMAVHDDVMPHMQDIRRYKNQIRDKIESMTKKGVSGKEVTTLNNLIDKLESADEAMMNWMRTFGRDYNEMDDDAAIAYLEDQKKKVIQVKNELETALREAEEALK